jgi:dihydrolipoamide dehydrogenase
VSTQIRIPDIGDFDDVPVIEVYIAVGDQVAEDDPLVTLESDKATMDVPAPQAGVVTALSVAVGDRVSEGTVILELETAESAPESEPAGQPSVAAESSASQAQPTASQPSQPSGAQPSAAQQQNGQPGARAVTGGAVPDSDVRAEVLVLGSGPGGYTAAFRAADLGKQVVLVERYSTLGGVCLNVGCIPSKALLHAAKVIAETREMSERGLGFGAPSIDVEQLRGWKDGVVSRLVGGVNGLAKKRKVTVVTGRGRFTSMNQLEVTADDGSTQTVGFEQAIIACGSEPIRLPFVPYDDARVIDSTGALELDDIPERLLVLGGGIIGLEMATVYHELGSKVSVVELMDQLIPGTDKDIVGPLAKRIGKLYERILLSTKVTDVQARSEGLAVTVERSGAEPEELMFDKVLVSVGRRPNGAQIGAENAGVAVDERGFIPVDKQQRTNVPHIFAIGDVVGQPMLAHKATHEGKVAAEVAAGKPSYFDAKVIPSVAYTDPEVAWAGLTENEAKAAGLDYGKGVFPWAASGRSLSLGRDEGLTKLIFDEATGRLLGCGIVGPDAGDLITEAVLAIEMGCDASDIGLSIHPHPTLSETVGLAAEAFEGTITDLFVPRKSPSGRR